MTRKVKFIVIALIAILAFYQILANNKNEIKTSLAYIHGNVLSDSDSNNNINIDYDTSWAGGAGIKSVHISKSGKIAVACDLEGCAVWVLDLIKNKVSFKFIFDQTVGPGFKDNSEIVEKCVREKPVDCAISDGDSFIYVTLYNANCVVEIPLIAQETASIGPTCDRTIGATIKNAVGQSKRMVFRAANCQNMPKMVSVSPDKKSLIISNWVSGSITIANIKRMKTESNIILNGGYKQYPRGISLDSVTNKFYVNNMGGGTISEINLATYKFIKNYHILPNPGHHTLSADKRHFFICDNIGKAFYKYNKDDKKIIDLVSFPENALLFGIDPQEKFAVVLHWYHNKVSVVNLNKMTIHKTINIHRPIGISFGKNFFIISSYGGGIGKLTKFSYRLTK